MKVEKDGDVKEINPMNLAVWRGRGYTEVKAKKERKAEQAEAVEKPSRTSAGKRKRSRKPRPGPSD